jgi:beta-N-acetylhexosaminidase
MNRSRIENTIACLSTVADQIDTRILPTMTIREKIGQLLHVGGIIGGVSADDEKICAAISAGDVSGVYLGYPHFANPEAAAEITAYLQALTSRPLFFAADFESGPGYNCADGCAHLPYLMGLGAIDDPEATRRAGEITAHQASAMGINWLYSPCVDVNLCRHNPIIGIRGFGKTEPLVTRMGLAFIEGCRNAGVLCTAKHFPGTGNTESDTHLGPAHDLGDLETWERETLPPFAALIDAGVPVVMTGHAWAPFLDPHETAATFSRPVLTGILRDRLGFDGLIMSDSLVMEGAAPGTTIPERCVMAFEAGCDILLASYDPGTMDAMMQALDSGRITMEQIDASVARIERAHEWLGQQTCGEICDADNAEARSIGRRSAQLHQGDGIPLQPGDYACVVQWRNDETQFFTREPGVLAHCQHALQRHDPSAPLVAMTRLCPEAEHNRLLDAVAERPTVVVFAIVKNYAGDPHLGKFTDGTAQLIQKLIDAGKHVVVAVLGTPYAADQLPTNCTFICASGDSLGCADGLIDLLTQDDA